MRKKLFIWNGKSCLTCIPSNSRRPGLRYSDVAKLRRSDVKKDYISVVTQKTVDGLIIELNKYSRAILKKYDNIGLPNDKATGYK